MNGEALTKVIMCVNNYPTETKSFRKEQQMKTENGLKFYPKKVFKCLLLEDFRNFRSARSFS